MILLQLSDVTSYFDVCSQSVVKYENEDIPKIHLTAEDHPWDHSINEYSERVTHISDHQGQISIPASVARVLVHVSAVI